MIRKDKALEYIVAYVAEHGYPPSLQDIADGVGLVARSSALRLVRALEADGAISRQPGIARSTRVLDRAA